METLTRAELADKIGRLNAEVSRNDVESFVDEFFETISGSLESGGVVRLSGLEIFYCWIKSSVQVVTQKLVRVIQYLPVVLQHSVQAIS